MRIGNEAIEMGITEDNIMPIIFNRHSDIIIHIVCVDKSEYDTFLIRYEYNYRYKTEKEMNYGGVGYLEASEILHILRDKKINEILE